LIQEVEINYLYAKSTDKDFIVVEGATTGVTPCTTCPLPASAYSNVTNNFFNHAANGSTTDFLEQYWLLHCKMLNALSKKRQTSC
jgi:hypothetical protein